MKWVEMKIVTPSWRDMSIRRLPESVALDRIDARSRLIENEHLRRMHDRDRKLQALANAERQVVGALVEIGR